MTILQVENASISFGGVKALQNISFHVKKDEVFSIIGPNGAGKTTLFNLISRIYDLKEGSLFFKGVDATNLSTHQIAKLGIARTFQNTELFEQETVLNNLLIGNHIHRKTSLLQEIIFDRKTRNQEMEFRENVEAIIDLLDLQAYRYQKISNLPYGIRKLVEIARALSMKPKLILLDEPSSGLNPEETEDLIFQIEDLRAELGITVLMIEHDMNLVSQISDRVMAIADGQTLIVGHPKEVQDHAEVIRAYLG